MQPSRADIITAAYSGTWEIWREISGSSHGDWVARRQDGRELRAVTIEDLAEKLEGETMSSPPHPRKGAS